MLLGIDEKVKRFFVNGKYVPEDTKGGFVPGPSPGEHNPEYNKFRNLER